MPCGTSHAQLGPPATHSRNLAFIQEPRKNNFNKMRSISLVIRALLWATKTLWTAARRWPAFAIVVAATLIILWPLGVDLFFTIPPSLRMAGAWCGFAVFLAACLNRLWRIDPKDDAPPAEQRAEFHWTALIPTLLCVAILVPYLRGPRYLGFGDWDLNLAKYEAVRRTVLEWGEFPWWDPWCRGGFPLAANPQCGVFGIATPLVLLLGTSVGMRIAQARLSLDCDRKAHGGWRCCGSASRSLPRLRG